jgi:predicted cation transporter
MHASIPPEPVLHVAVGLFTIFILVLILPFRVRKVEENLEPFFFLMGVAAVTISGLWSTKLVEEALTSPVSVGNLPIGIFQVVLIAGLVVHYCNKPVYGGIAKLMDVLGLRFFVFVIITILGLVSSLVSVIVTAVILAEVITVLPLDRKKKVGIAVITCFAVGLGAALTPVGEPLSAIAVSKLSGPPYHADFLFLFKLLGKYVIPGIIALAIFGAFYVGHIKGDAKIPEYTESLRVVILRAVRVYFFIAALILLGGGFTPLAIWYFTKIPPEALYWINVVSAILDNATLTAAEIGPSLSILQIKSALMALLISGGMLIPGNVPNIVTAGRLRITSREWAKTGLPIGFVLLAIYFIILHVLFV